MRLLRVAFVLSVIALPGCNGKNPPGPANLRNQRLPGWRSTAPTPFSREFRQATPPHDDSNLKSCICLNAAVTG